jgi:hypothetical protein
VCLCDNEKLAEKCCDDACEYADACVCEYWVLHGAIWLSEHPGRNPLRFWKNSPVDSRACASSKSVSTEGRWNEMSKEYDSTTSALPAAPEADEGTLQALEDGLQELDFDEAPTVGETIEAALSQLAPDEARLGRYLATAIIEHEEAADIDSLSPETFLAGEEFDGDENVMPDGYIGLLAPLADGIEVQLGRTVTSIRDDTDGVKIGFTDGTNATADAVLVTVPLGVLKAGVIEFDPVLPDDKLAAIERLGMGVLNRVILEYDERFWDDDVEVIGFVGEEPGLFVEWYDWTRVVGKPVIVGFNAGSVAERLESLDDDAIIALATSALDTMYT